VELEGQLHKVQNGHDLDAVAVVLGGSHIVDVGLDQNHGRQLEGGVDRERSPNGTLNGGRDRDRAHEVVVVLDRKGAAGEVHDLSPEVSVGRDRGQKGRKGGFDMVDDSNRDR
jgi:hypothetical protein